MKIESIHIDGFGQFHNYSIKDISPGLTILNGANEAGKSTLLSFVRRVLFGFPSRSMSSNPYQPLEGGNHGGRLIVHTDANDRCVIERYTTKGNDAVVTYADGTVGEKTDLSKILGFADKEIFKNIFAFGLDELQSFETLKSNSVNSRLYSAGTGIGAISISDIQKTLKKRETDLYKKQGRKPPINTLFKNIKDTNSEIRVLEGEQEQYDSLHNESEKKSKTIKNLNSEQKEIQKQLNHVNELISIWDDWVNLQDSYAALNNLPTIHDFPEKGFDKLDRLQEKMDEITSKITLIQKDLEKNTVEQKDIHVDEILLNKRDEIFNLRNGIDKYRSDRESLPLLKRNVDDEQSNLRDLFNELGAGWDEEKLNQFDYSIPAKETVIQKRIAIKDIEGTIQGIQHELSQIEHDIERIAKGIKDIDDELHSYTIEVSEDEVNQKLESVRHIRIKYPILKEKDSELKNIQKEAVLFSKLQPKKAPVWPAAIFILTGIIGLAYGYSINEVFFGLIIFIILLIIGIAYFFSTRQNESKLQRDDTTTQTNEKTREFPDLIKQLENEISAARNEILKYAKICEFHDIPDPALLEQKDKELNEIANDLRIVQELSERRNKLSNELVEQKNQYSDLDSRLKAEEDKQAQIIQKWESWLSRYDLDPALSPESILEIFSTIKTCYDKQKSIHSLESQYEANRVSVKTYEEKIYDVLDYCNRSTIGITYDTELELLREDVDTAFNNAEQLKRLNKEKEKLTIDLESATEENEKLKKELSELLASGSSETVDDFIRHAGIWEQRLQLQEDIQNAEKQIKRISGEKYDDFIKELESTDLSSLHEKEESLENHLTELNNEITSHTDERGAIRNKIEQLEYSHDASHLRLQREAYSEDLHTKSREWAILVLAQEILNKAIEVYEKERQPAVIIEAQSFFSKITNGRYTRIYSPLNSSEIFVEDQNGKQKNILQLSRGTAEQLYLALRFGFIKEFGKHSESLPIVFDDILVNFDPDRSRSAGASILELAETNQIFYFTCHPETKEMFMDLAPEAKVIELDNYVPA